MTCTVVLYIYFQTYTDVTRTARSYMKSGGRASSNIASCSHANTPQPAVSNPVKVRRPA